LVAVVVWVITFEITRYVSVASVVAALVLPCVVLVITKLNPAHGFLLFYFSICLAALVVLRHRSNLLRLVRGTEQRFDRREN
jgi:acyl phosphate:glycerol-3-phosphate acyltransferase